jgi:hypothetical protein
VFLNRAFEAAVRKRLGKYAEQVLKPRCLAEVLRYFDHFIKVEFKDEVEFINFAIPGTPDIPEAEVEDGFMSMTRCDHLCILIDNQRGTAGDILTTV